MDSSGGPAGSGSGSGSSMLRRRQSMGVGAANRPVPVPHHSTLPHASTVTEESESSVSTLERRLEALVLRLEKQLDKTE
jgi:hypothetical protein